MRVGSLTSYTKSEGDHRLPALHYGLRLSASQASTSTAWREALDGFFLLLADPISVIGDAIESDHLFAMGPVFRAAYSVLSGAPTTSPQLVADVALAQRRRGNVSEQEQRHIDAVAVLAGHNFTAAAALWDSIIRDHPDDLLAVRIAHDIYLHVGNDAAKLVSLTPAVEAASASSQELGLLKGMLAFAYEELGRYDEAEREGREALAINDGDIWAVHALSHVFEMQGRSADSLLLLDPTERWTRHDLLANHLWWHRAIRLTADRRLDEAIAITDRFEFDESMAFTLCDYSSLLWRIEAQGGDVGDRWNRAVSTWDKVAARHTNAFLDLHAALALAATASPSAIAWQRSLSERVDLASAAAQQSENDDIFREVAKPLVDAVLGLRTADRAKSIERIKALEPALHRIGGSRAQRQVVDLSIETPHFGVQK